MDKAFLERLGASTYIYVNFEKYIQERFSLQRYQSRHCHVHYTRTEGCDLRLAADLADPSRDNFLTISYQTRNRDFLVRTKVHPTAIENLAREHGVPVDVTECSYKLNIQTRISVEKSNSKKVVAFLLALSDLALECLI